MRRMVLVLLAAAVTVSVAACGILGGGTDLTSKTWQWTAATTVSPASQSVVPNPANYTITFAADGTYAGKADCNQIAGTYTTSGSSLTIKPGPSTLMACASPDSLDALYVAGLLSTTQYKIEAGGLTTMNAAGDTMQFKGS